MGMERRRYSDSKRGSRRQKANMNIFLLLFFVMILMMMVVAVKLISQGDGGGLGDVPPPVEEPQVPALILTAEQNQALAQLPLNSTHAIMMTADGKTQLMDRGGAEQIYPASMTKMMTALVTLEHMQSLQDTVTLPTEMIKDLLSKHAAMAGFSAGEAVSVKDLLYGAMLPSGAECSRGLADYIAGSEEAFADLMNAKAQELGMTGTHFTNATGLHNNEHYSTAKDMAVLLIAALQNPAFREILMAAGHTSGATEYHPEGLTFGSTVLGNLSKMERTDTGILGGKTGYTPEAGLCLASLMTLADREYILITAGAPGNPWNPLHVKDACTVYDCIREMGLQ